MFGTFGGPGRNLIKEPLVWLGLSLEVPLYCGFVVEGFCPRHQYWGMPGLRFAEKCILVQHWRSRPVSREKDRSQNFVNGP